MVLGMRKVRAVVLMTGAVIAIGTASIAYLRPAPAPAAPEVRHPNSGPAVEWTQSQLVQNINLTGRTHGGYFVWERHGGGSGGHAA
jgi:hypothetical protein